jgi:hypothetical protein
MSDENNSNYNINCEDSVDESLTKHSMTYSNNENNYSNETNNFDSKNGIITISFGGICKFFN